MLSYIVTLLDNKKIKSLSLKITAFIMLLINSATTALFGLLVGQIMNAIISKNPLSFYKLLIITIISLIIGSITNIIAWTCIHLHSSKKILGIKNHLYDYEISKTRDDKIDMSNFSTKMEIIYNDNYISKWNIMKNAILFLFSTTVLIYIDLRMFLIAFVAALIPIIIPTIFTEKTQKVMKEYSKQNENFLSRVSDVINGRLEIKKYKVQNEFRNNYIKDNILLEKDRCKNNIFSNMINSITELAGSISFILVFLIGGFLSINNQLKPGDLLGIIQLMNYLVYPIVSISISRNKIISSNTLLNDIKKLKVDNSINTDKLLINNKQDIELRAENISFGYTDNNIINDFCYTFSTKKKYLIQGQSGSGKTTLAKLLSGELLPNKGSISINNTNIEKISSYELYDLIKYIDQKSYLFEDTIYNNIDLYRSFSKSQISELLKELELKDLDSELIINDDLGLSGGQKSRINLSRGIINPPQILIFDEPTSSLDEKTSLNLLKYIINIPSTIIVISHTINKQEIELFDEIIKM